MKISKKVLQLITFVVSVIILVGLDQYTKYLAVINLKGKNPFIIIDGVFELNYLQNAGAAWGILSDGRTALILFTCVILVFIVVVVYRTPNGKKYLPFRCVLNLLCAGACGNLIDRVMNGYVHDFLYFKLIDFPIFNVSDMYVSVSMFVLIFLVFFVYKDNDFDFLVFKKSRKETDKNEKIKFDNR